MIIDTLHQLHLTDALTTFLPDSEFYNADAKRNAVAQSVASKNLYSWPIQIPPRMQLPHIPSYFPLTPDLFTSYPDFIDRMEVFLNQFNTQGATLTVTVIEEPPKRYARIFS